jgi:hypothetical protein
VEADDALLHRREDTDGSGRPSCADRALRYGRRRV